jgi:hypothetical protein
VGAEYTHRVVLPGMGGGSCCWPGTTVSVPVPALYGRRLNGPYDQDMGQYPMATNEKRTTALADNVVPL